MDLTEYLEFEQYSLNRQLKQKHMAELSGRLHRHHYINSDEYKKLTIHIFNDIQDIDKIEDLPFLPVSLFKSRKLKSVPESDVYKILTSSGTTSSVPSLIYLDTFTARMQTVSLSKILSHVLGKERIPMLIVDSKSVIKDRSSFSARGAGIVGISVFGKNHHYLLDDIYKIDFDAFKDFIMRFNGQRILIFGFTYMVWQFLYLTNYKFDIDLSNAILLHSGGWKKMQEMAVDNDIFKTKLNDKFGIKNVYNFYGMVEQVGSIFLENEEGYLHCPNFADIIIRNPDDLSIQKNGKAGLIQTISVLPHSYPGHSLLTEDIGVCVGEDTDIGKWNGKYFKILGRASKADLRGCSDTFMAD